MPGDGDGGGDGDVAFVFPRDGFTLNQADDADGDTSNGIQVDPPVRVAYGGPTGTELTLTSDQGEMATADVDDDGFARFSGFTVNGAPDGLPVVLTATDGTAEDEIEIEAITEVPLRVCTITSPADNAVLGPLDDAAINNPGFQAAVDVECQGVDAGTDVAVSVEGAVAQTVALDANGDAQAVVTLPNTDVGNNSNEISIDVDGLADEIDVTVVLTPPDPSVSITAPADGAALSPGDVDVTATSANATSATYDLDCSDDANDATGVALTLNAGTGDVTGTITGLSSDPPNTCELTVTVDDGDGNTASDNVSFTVSAIAVAMDFPCDADDNGYLVASEDADDGTDMVMNCAVPVTATFDSGTWTATGQLWDLGADVDDDADDVQVGADQDLGTLTSDMSVSFALAAPYGDEQAYEVRISVTDGTDTIEAAAAISVDTVAPTLTWNNPIDASTLNAVNDDVQTTPGFQPFFSLTAVGMADGSTVDLAFSGGPGAPFSETCTVVASGACNRDDITIGDGMWTVGASATDAAGNSTATPSEVSFTSDGTAPAVATPVEDNIQILDDEAGDDNGWLNAVEAGDGQGVASSDVTVTFATNAGIEDGVTVGLLDGSTTLATATAASNAVTFPAVALPQGALSLGVSASDAAGNPIPMSAPRRAFNVDTVDPTLTISAPAAGALTEVAQDVAVLTDAEDGQTVEVYDVTGAETLLGSNTVNSGGATVAVTFPEGDIDIEVRVTDQAGNVTTASVSYSVDATAPELTLTLLSDPGTDQDLVTPGFQVDFTVDYDGLPAGGADITLASDLSMQVVGTINPGDASGSTTVRATFFQSGSHGVTASATDDAGNLGVSNSLTVAIVTGNYDVIVLAPALVGGDLLYGTGSLPASITVDVPGFPGGVVDLRIDGLTEPSQMLTDNMDGTYTITWTATDGDGGTLEVYVNDLAGVPTTGSTGDIDYLVDVGTPTVAFTTLVDNAVFNAADLQPGTPGLQTSVDVDVTECENGTIEINEGATLLGTASVGAGGSGTIAVGVEDLTDHASATWTASCTDAVGNTANAAVLTEVDTVAPDAPIVNLAVLDAKLGQIEVTVTVPGDDADGGPNATVRVAASPVAVNEAGFDALFAQDFRPALGGPVTESSATAPGNDLIAQTDALAPDQEWFIVVRAFDNAGNTSFASASETLTTTEYVYDHIEDATGCADDRYGFPISRPADFNNDGFNDLALAAPGEGSAGCYLSYDEGAVYLYAGQADLSSIDYTAPSRRLYEANTYARGKRMDVGDVNGDGFDDLVVAQESYLSPFHVQLAVFYGETGADLVRDTPVTISLGADQFTIGIDSLKFIGDVNGDGFDDMYVGPWNGFSADTTRGRILFGQSADFDATFTNNTVTVLDATTAGATLLRSATSLGNLDGDMAGGGGDLEDFALAVQGRGLLIIRGRETWPATLDLATIVAPDVLACPGTGCGRELTSGDINGDGGRDIVLTRPPGNEVRIFLNTGAGTFPASTGYNLRPPGQLLDFKRAGMAVGDVNADGYTDVLIAQRDANGATPGATLWLGSDRPPATYTEPSVLYPLNIDFASAGRMISCGDLDNDGDDEICYVAESDGSTLSVRD